MRILRILIPTLASRKYLLKRLLDVLLPQIVNTVHYDVIGYWNNGELPIGTIRQQMLDQAVKDGVRYIAWIDDDDLVSDNYVKRISTPIIMGPHNEPPDSPDIIGFIQQVHILGEAYGVHPLPAYLDWDKYKGQGWYTDGIAYYRDLAHEMCMRTELAALGRFDGHDGVGEDQHWAGQVRKELLSRKVNATFINETLYHYHFDWDHSSQSPRFDPTVAPYSSTGTDTSTRLQVNSPVFRWFDDA